jgi:HAD superfamily hydrolase (TIGR01509 family)
LIRRSLGLPAGAPILETIALRPAPERAAMHEWLFRYEMRAARESRLFPGAGEFLREVRASGWKTALFTRNARLVAHASLQTHGLAVDLLVAREDAPPKPDPAGLLRICAEWGCGPGQLVFLGDYLYDLEAGERAGVPTLLYAPGPLPGFAHRARGTYRDYAEALRFVRGLHLHGG